MPAGCRCSNASVTTAAAPASPASMEPSVAISSGRASLQAPERSSVGAGRFGRRSEPTCCAVRRASPPAASASPAEVEPVSAKSQPGYFGRERPHGQRKLAGGESCERVIVVTERVRRRGSARPSRRRARPRAQAVRSIPAGPGLFRGGGALARSPRRRRPASQSPSCRQPPRPATTRGSDGPRGEAPLVVQHPQNGKGRRASPRRPRPANRVSATRRIPGLGDPGRGIRQALDR